jgi:hypothetical protein
MGASKEQEPDFRVLIYKRDVEKTEGAYSWQDSSNPCIGEHGLILDDADFPTPFIWIRFSILTSPTE